MISELIGTGVGNAISFASDKFPEETAIFLGAMTEVGEAANVAVSYVDEKTGKVISRNWNKIPQDTRDLIKGGVVVATFVVPAGSAAKIGNASKNTVLIGGKTCVYSCVINGVTRYVGITDDIITRGAAHLRNKGIVIKQIPGLKNLSRVDARAVEQTLIHYHGLGKNGGTLINKINSISPTRNPTAYENALKRGAEILKQNNYPGF